MRRRIANLVLLLLAGVSMPAYSQRPASPGDRVRVSPRAGAPLTGTLLADRADSVLVATDAASAPRAIARGEIARLEVSDGLHRHRLRNGVFGAIAGGLAGSVIGAATSHPTTSGCTSGPNQFFGCNAFAGLDQVYGAIIGGAFGAALGGGIGVYLGSKPTERWLPAGDGRTARVRLEPVGAAGLRVVATLAP